MILKYYQYLEILKLLVFLPDCPLEIKKKNN